MCPFLLHRKQMGGERPLGPCPADGVGRMPLPMLSLQPLVGPAALEYNTV